MVNSSTPPTKTQSPNLLDSEPDDYWFSETKALLDSGVILPDEFASLPIEELGPKVINLILERRFKGIVHRLRAEYDAPVCSNGREYWMWAGTLDDLPDPGEDLEGFLTCIRLAKKQGWPIPTGKGDYQGRGRPRQPVDDFISRAVSAFRANPNMSKAKLAEFMGCDESSIKRRYRKAGYKTYLEFKMACTS